MKIKRITNPNDLCSGRTYLLRNDNGKYLYKGIFRELRDTRCGVYGKFDYKTWDRGYAHGWSANFDDMYDFDLIIDNLPHFRVFEIL